MKHQREGVLRKPQRPKREADKAILCFEEEVPDHEAGAVQEPIDVDKELVGPCGKEGSEGQG
ncbi:hypothetical protein GOP47_0023908 [Adiantum capillus-veneris]|uniref:Uncharacterized protein n=1 Tax=Adiantum capillus-veneris TaxID=13818 RepID=A0A9D4Z3T0_ADICA|nr:hypothetical protein GOP47_0023908 [Adiantum capillus-veneris]